MKTDALHASFFFFFALFSFTRAEYVYDTEGDPVINGGKYYLYPALVGGGDIVGAEIPKGESEACSLAVVTQAYTPPWPVGIGTPIEVHYINTTSFLRISFADLPPNPCTQTPNWIVVPYPGFGDAVMVGSAEEYPAAVTGWFFIKPYDSEKHIYYLIFCHKIDECGNVGEQNDGHLSRLVITDKDVHLFQLGKAEENVASGISMVV